MMTTAAMRSGIRKTVYQGSVVTRASTAKPARSRPGCAKASRLTSANAMSIAKKP